MPIIRRNIAICNGCGKQVVSADKQSLFLSTLKSQGWKGNVEKILCPKCSRKLNNKDGMELKEYKGNIKRIVIICDKPFVVVQNPKVEVYIPAFQFGYSSSDNVTIEDLRLKLLNRNLTTYDIKYINVRTEKIKDKTFMTADWKEFMI